MATSLWRFEKGLGKAVKANKARVRVTVEKLDLLGWRKGGPPKGKGEVSLGAGAATSGGKGKEWSWVQRTAIMHRKQL